MNDRPNFERIPSFPESICVRVTRACNARCAFCQAPNTDPRKIAIPEFKTIVQFLRTQGVRTLKLSGGEPTTRINLPDFVRHSSTAGLRPTIITNGINISDAVLDAVRNAHGEFKFSIHHYSALNDEVLGVRCFSRVLNNVQRILAYEIPISINTVLTRCNFNIVEKMVEFGHAIGARKISFIPFVPRGRGLSCRNELDFDHDTIIHIRDKIATVAQGTAALIEVRIIDIRRRDYWIIENDGDLWIERAMEQHDELVATKEVLLKWAGAFK